MCAEIGVRLYMSIGRDSTDVCTRAGEECAHLLRLSFVCTCAIPESCEFECCERGVGTDAPDWCPKVESGEVPA